MLKAHKFYLYHEGAEVYGRMDDKPRVLVEKCATPQEAHDKVQAVLNPKNLPGGYFGPMGFASPEFKKTISGNCEGVVTAAYARKAA